VLAKANETLVDDETVAHRSGEHGLALPCFPHLDGECFARKYRRSESAFNVLETICIATTQRIQQAATCESVCAQTMQDWLWKYSRCNRWVIWIGMQWVAVAIQAIQQRLVG
jgi:hypothetical protein